MQIQKRFKVSFIFSLTVLVIAAHSQAEMGKDSTATTVLVQNTNTTAKLPSSLKTHNFGGGAGFVSGYGFTYRHWCPSLNGYQVTFIPVGRVNDNEGFFNSSLGAMGLRSLHRTEYTNFFGYYGAHYNFTYDSYSGSYYDYPYDASSPRISHSNNSTEHFLFAGGGLGMEIHFWNINYSLMFGYTGNFSSSQNVSNNSQYVPTDNGKWKRSFEFQPSIESGLFYCF